jgi:hypothetical protein
MLITVDHHHIIWHKYTDLDCPTFAASIQLVGLNAGYRMVCLESKLTNKL